MNANKNIPNKVTITGHAVPTIRNLQCLIESGKHERNVTVYIELSKDERHIMEQLTDFQDVAKVVFFIQTRTT